METTFRCYRQDSDYEKVSQFLVRTYGASGGHVNWLQPRWEYMHYHPLIKGVDLRTIGVWEAAGEIVAVVHPEHYVGCAHFEIDPAYGALKSEMLAYAEEHLCTTKDGDKALSIYINDRDDAFQAVAAERGYRKREADRTTHSGFEAMSRFDIPDPFPAIRLPGGFRLKSLAQDNDVRKLTRVIFRGFNEGDEPPDDGVADRNFMQSAPHYRKDLNIVAEAPDGSFVSYCGMWYEPVHRIAYVEPVCTDHAYRRMGLASAAVREGIRRCGEQGATAAYVGAVRDIYLSLGFLQVYNRSAWRREWT